MMTDVAEIAVQEKTNPPKNQPPRCERLQTEYWIQLLQATKYLKPKQTQSILSDNSELQKLLTSIIKTTKQNPKPKTTP